MRTLSLFLVVGFCAVGPAIALADPDAETLKQEGISAAKNKDWTSAREKFQASYQLAPKPLTLFNLAAAQEQTDLLIEARVSYRKFLEITVPGDANEKFRKVAHGKLADLDTQIPTIRITVTGFKASIVVELDRRALPPSDLDAPIPVDPGKHTISASRGTEQLVSREVTIPRGARAETVLVAPPPKVTDPSDPKPPGLPPPHKTTERGGILSSGWFWLATSVVVLGGTAAGYYYVIRDAPVADPQMGTLGTFTIR
ncbi:MAG: hypothetical protein IPQ07_28415 [Myxococcales bacterium]|nr:hypothetical protein [Myxococcales bacterium]